MRVWIRQLKLRDVRCFEGEQSARLGRRITLLVGDNGAGKSTFMGCYKAFANLASFDDLDEKNHFDEAPFRMGGFDSIVRSGKNDFTVGGAFEDHCHASASFTFRAQGGSPVDRELHLSVARKGRASQDFWISAPDEPEGLLRFGVSDFDFDLRRSELEFRSITTWLSRHVGQGHLPFAGDVERFRKQTGESGSERELEFVKFINFLKRDFPFPAPGSFVVSAPDPAPPDRERSYRVPPTHLTSEGSDAPYEFLSEAGEKLGLWHNISFANGPGTIGTEVMVETAPNVWHNLVDAGHGIHSLLPLLAHIAAQPPEAVVLLQQPEVRVHPRTQAELAQWMAESGRSFMIETHSDHLVDRFRICVMKGILAPEDLSIVYFQPSEDRTQSRIHGIGVDDHGNLEGSPPEYRSFFLEETHDLLGIG